MTKVGFLPSLWKINFLTLCDCQTMNQARRSWKQVSVQQRECSPFSSMLRGPLLSTYCPTKLQSLPHIKQFQLCQKFPCIFSQRHGFDVGVESSCITTMQLLTKLASHSRTLAIMVSVWWNTHHTHPTWPRAIPKIKSVIAEKPFSMIQDLAKAVH